jgi:uncharacterized membrane protein YesL
VNAVRRISAETYQTVFAVLYLGFVTNALLALGALPFVVALLTARDASSLPLLAALAPFATPSLAAAFAVFSAFSADSSISVARTFVAAYRATWRRAVALGAAATGAIVVLGVDAAWAWGGPAAPWAVPALAVLLTLVVATGLLGLVGIAEVPTVRLRDVLRASAFLAVRRWYLTLASLAAIGLLATFVAAKPALAIGLAAAPILYVVWANGRYSLRPVLPAQEALTTA